MTERQLLDEVILHLRSLIDAEPSRAVMASSEPAAFRAKSVWTPAMQKAAKERMREYWAKRSKQRG